MNPRSQPTPMLTAAQAGEILALTPRQVLELARRGQLRHVRYSPRIVRFDPVDIQAFIESQKSGADQGARRAA
jgi:hypothetical protein